MVITYFDDHLVEDGADNELTWPRPSSQTRENSVETVEEKMVESNTKLGRTKIRSEMVKKDKNVWVKHTKAKIMYGTNSLSDFTVFRY